MRLLFMLPALLILLCGCHSSAPETVPEPTHSTIAQTTPPATIAKDPPDQIQLLLNVMSTEEKVGQLFLARCPGDTAIEDIKTYHLGGYLLFGQDFEGETPDSMKNKLAEYQSSSPIPLLIAVDEEGGSVCRVSRYPAFRSGRFPSPREAYAEGGMESVLSAETEKAALLHSLDINVNMGPVCDISTGFGAFMYPRSLGEDAATTGRFVSSTVQIMAQYRIGSVLKHFPGYGNSDDTHVGIAWDKRSLEELEAQDLIPFTAGITAGCDAILVSHTIVTAFDDTLPATLSPAVHRYLREDMGFDAVVVTDDLIMQAITDAYGTEEAAVLAVLAGNDLLCSSEYQVQYQAVLDAVASGRIPEDQLNASVTRILNWKRDLGLIF